MVLALSLKTHIKPHDYFPTSDNHASPRLPPSSSHATYPFNAMFGTTRKPKLDGVKTEFVFADGAKDDVQLSGDWNDWKAIQMFHEGGGMWSVVTPVPPGPHEFKFIVDGEWKHSNRHPTIGIDDTSLNNVRVVLQQPDLGEKNAQRSARESRAKSRDSRASRDSKARESRASRARKPGGLFGK